MPVSKRGGASPRSKEPGSLQRYHRKRDFTETPEPRGKRAKAGKRLRFVIQKHHASRLHYDFRLEADGVLKSWAIPKGPSLTPGERRLAMHVEDHPMDYRTFEGIIPKGNYGAGEVIVWDEGTYELSEGDDPAKEIGKGKIKFVMHGKKMRGEFTLVRIKGRGGESGDPWLLLKDHDEFADPGYDVEKDNKSVKTGRTVESYAEDPKAPHWVSGKKAASAKSKKAPARAKRDPIPVIKTPMLATLVDEPFDDAGWLFEIKWDGYRAICTVDEKGNLSLVSRNGLDFLTKFPEMDALRSAWKTLPIVVDGEIVSLDSQGRSSFQRLQESLNSRRASGRPKGKSAPLNFVAFDLLYADGKDLRKTPLEERKDLLERAIADPDLVLYSKHVLGKGRALFKKAEERTLEGIIGKRRDSAYVERRTRDWVKIKAQLVQEFVIGGFTEPRGSRSGFGSLLLGLYDRGKLYYVGHVGTGFDTKTLHAMTADLKKIERKTTPFANKVEANTKAHWVDPKLVAEVRFTEWTRDGYLRQPAFLGLRLDKEPKACVRERPIDTGEVA